MHYKIKTPIVRFYNQRGDGIAETKRPADLVGLASGQQISPFTTARGKVLWEVSYVEEIDSQYTFVHIKDLGYIQ